jgi:hypothetical protein
MKVKTNHEFVILDASGSMAMHEDSVVKVTDALISTLAEGAKTFPDIETRISVYTFNSGTGVRHRDNVQNLIWDMDVLRMPSIAGMYKPEGGTPLCEAVITVMDDIARIPVMHGDHAILAYLVTDAGSGGEHSMPHFVAALPGRMRAIPDTWTLAAMVPGLWSKTRLINYGFAPGNIEVWDPTRREGVEEMGQRIGATSSAYAAARRGGMKSTASLYAMAAPLAADLAAALVPLTQGSYYFEPVTDDDLMKITGGRIDQFMQLKTGVPYIPGNPVVFYQMFKRERIQHYKRLAVAIPDHQDKSVRVYTGAAVRAKLGLPVEAEKIEVRVSPGRWPDYKVFVETGSPNRRLYPGTSVLVMR